MARTTKIGIDYFSHDVDMSQDVNMRILVAKHGLFSYAVYNRLLEELYRDKGYYLEINEDFNILFSNDCNIEIDAYINILNDIIMRKMFSSDMFSTYSILTSARVQRNYCDAICRRKEASFINEYLMIDPRGLLPDKINVCINSLNADSGTQSKGKESKEKENKEKESKLNSVACVNASGFVPIADFDPGAITDAESDFELFYASYPNPQKKPMARTAFMNALGTMPSVQEMIAIIDERIEMGQWSRNELQWIPAPARYLSEEGYNDPVVPRVKKEKEETPAEQVKRRLAEIERGENEVRS